MYTITYHQVDLLPNYGELPFSLEYFCEAQDLEHLAAMIGDDDTPFGRRFGKLAQGLCEVVDGFHLVDFLPLAIEDGFAVARVLQMVDRANGYAMTPQGAREQHMRHDLTRARLGEYNIGMQGVEQEGHDEDTTTCGDVAER